MRMPVQRVAFTHAKIIHIMVGRSRIETRSGVIVLVAGDPLVLGGGVWCSATPLPWVRTWTIYLDETFLRQSMQWALPHIERVLPALHPGGWYDPPLA